MALNVLIVDDSRVVRSVVAKALRVAQLPMNQILEAENGQEALDVVRDNWIDLIIADINMPVMNGIEMIKRLVADEVTASIPIVVVSSEGSEARIAELEEKGVRAFLRKPFQPEQLRDVVVQNLGEIDE